MPMTPWHFGIGMPCKAVGGRHVSLSAFLLSQVLIDIEVVYRILNQLPKPHGVSHTMAGAVGIGVVTVMMLVPGVWLVQRSMGLVDRPRWVAWSSAWWGAMLGTISHVWLDSVMHTDVQPFWPISAASPLHQAISNVAIHELCFWSGAVGLIAWGVRIGWERWGKRLWTNGETK